MVQHSARLEMVAAGDDPTSISTADRAKLVQAVALRAGVPTADVTLSVVAASLLLVFEIRAPSAANAGTMVANLIEVFQTPESANAVLADTGVVVVAAPTVKAVERTVQAPDGSQSLPTADIIGFGSAALVVLGAGGCWLYYRRKKKKSEETGGPTINIFVGGAQRLSGILSTVTAKDGKSLLQGQKEVSVENLAEEKSTAGLATSSI